MPLLRQWFQGLHLSDWGQGPPPGSSRYVSMRRPEKHPAVAKALGTKKVVEAVETGSQVAISSHRYHSQQIANSCTGRANARNPAFPITPVNHPISLPSVFHARLVPHPTVAMSADQNTSAGECAAAIRACEPLPRY